MTIVIKCTGTELRLILLLFLFAPGALYLTTMHLNVYFSFLNIFLSIFPHLL